MKKAAVRGAALVLLLASACDDDVDAWSAEAGLADASSKDAGADAAMRDAGPLLGCQQADEALGSRLHATDASLWADLERCVRDEDCTSWSPVFRCEDRSVQLSQCTAPIAANKLEAAERWLDGFERELCPQIAPGCRGTGDCLGGQPRCVQERCSFVRDGGG